MADNSTSLAVTWHEIVDDVKNRMSNRTLWEVLEKTAAITIEDDTLILGLPSRSYNQAGHLNISENRNAIERSAGQVIGRSLKMRVIEGETLEDWIFTKKRDERVAAMKAARYEEKDRLEDEAQSWEALIDKITKSWSATQNRSFPQTKARFLTEMLYLVTDAMESLYPDDRDESTERLLARVLEKLAGCTDLPSPLISLELDRLRAWKKRQI